MPHRPRATASPVESTLGVCSPYLQLDVNDHYPTAIKFARPSVTSAYCAARERSSAPTSEPGRRPSLVVPRQQGRARNPLFSAAYSTASLRISFSSVFLPRMRCRLGNLGTRGGQFGGWHHGLAGRHRRQRALTFELAPLEQQAGGNTFLTGHQRHAHTCLVGSSNRRRLLCKGPVPAALVPRKNLDRLCFPSRTHSPTPILKDKRWTMSGHSGASSEGRPCTSGDLVLTTASSIRLR